MSEAAALKFPKKPAGPQWKAPAHLADATRRWFTSVVRDYELDEHHVRLLTLACEAWDSAQMARAIVARKGLTFEDRFDQPRVRPEVLIERDARIAYARLLRELALDVSAPGDDSRPPTLGFGRRRA